MRMLVDYRGGSAGVRLSGELGIEQSSELYGFFRDVARRPEVESVELDFAEAGAIHSASAVTIRLGKQLLEEAGKAVRVTHLSEAQGAVLRSIPERPPGTKRSRSRRQAPLRWKWGGAKRRPKGSLLERVGSAGIEIRTTGEEIADMLFRTLGTMGGWLRVTGRRRRDALIEQTVLMGADAVLLVALLGLSMGVVLAFQAASQLRQFGTGLFMAEVVGLGMVREFGAVITAVILSARSGASMAAELGTMAVNEELDALRSMGIDPVRYLVAPRLLAMTIVTPFLSLMATAAGIAGGVAIAGLLEVPARAVYHRMIESLVLSDFVLCLVKSVLFAWIIALVGCFMGLRTRGGAHNVGRNTTGAVVVSILLIVVTDTVVTIAWILANV